MILKFAAPWSENVDLGVNSRPARSGEPGRLSVHRWLRARKPGPVLVVDAPRLDWARPYGMVRPLFRDPERVTPVREGIIVAPADGRISRIIQAAPPPELGLGERPLMRVSIFMNVFDCHVNRSPVSGRIEKIVYKAGAFINAELD